MYQSYLPIWPLIEINYLLVEKENRHVINSICNQSVKISPLLTEGKENKNLNLWNIIELKKVIRKIKVKC